MDSNITKTLVDYAVNLMFSGLNNYTLLAIPFFIISGTIASRGKTSEYLTRVMSIIFGRIKGGDIIATIASDVYKRQRHQYSAELLCRHRRGEPRGRAHQRLQLS